MSTAADGARAIRDHLATADATVFDVLDSLRQAEAELQAEADLWPHSVAHADLIYVRNLLGALSILRAETFRLTEAWREATTKREQIAKAMIP